MTSALSLPDSTPARTASALSVEGLRHVYGDHVALDNVSWQARAGEAVCLLGHSGCGKTTLLRLIAGLEAPTAGRILLDGQEVSGPATFVPPEQRRIGLVFQDYALFPHLSVLDNVCFGLPDRKSAASRERAEAGLARVGMSRHAGSYPHMLSGGEQQRVALARALAPEPRVLLMDEPFSNLDRRLRDQVRDDTMALLRETGTTAIVVTHDPEEALRIADQIVLLHAGRVAQSGTAETLYHRPASLFAARYFSDLNAIPGHCRNGVIDTPLGAFPGTTEANTKVSAEVSVYLRPQDIHLAGSAAPDTVAAQVSRRLFIGQGEELHVSVPGLATPLILRQPRESGLAAGSPAHLRLDRQRAFVFPASTPP